MIALTKIKNQPKNLLLLIAASLYVLSLFTTNYVSNTLSPKMVQQHLSNAIQLKENSFKSLLEDTNLIKQIAENPTSVKEEIKLTEYPFGIFIYSFKNGNPNLIYWNSNRFSTSKDDIFKKDTSQIVQYQNGYFEFIKKTICFNDNTYSIIGLLPIYWDYFLENKYLKDAFDNGNNAEQLYEITEANNAIPIYNIQQQVLYKIQKKTGNIYSSYDIVTIILRVIAILCLLFYIQLFSKQVSTEKGFKKGFLLLFSSLFSLRIITYFTNFPFDKSRLSLFDPSIYASNIIHPSLGDLLINCILILWLVFFYKFNNNNKILDNNVSKFIGIRKIFPYINLALLVLITLIITSTIKSLVLDSKISLDVTNFFGLTIYSVISFIILCFCALIFFHTSHIFLYSVFQSKIKLSIQLLVTAAIGLLIISFQVSGVSVLLNMLSIAWLLLYLIIINFRKKDTQLSIIKSSYFIVWIAFFSITEAALVMQQNTLIENEQRKKWAEKLAEQTDPNSETLLQIATLNFNNNFLTINFNRFHQEFANKFLKDSLVNENFSGYLNKYDTRIYTFDSLFNPLYNDDAVSYAVIKTIILNQGKETNIPSLYSYDNTNGRESYIYEKVIEKDSAVEGYLFVTVKPKSYKSEALYPELFRQVQNLSSDFNTHYAYAIYNNNILVNSFNDYSFQSSIATNSLPNTKFEKRNVDGFNELWYNTGSGKVVVIVKKHTAILELMTLFAYLFCVFIIVIALFHISNFIIKTRFKKTAYQKAFHFSIRNQIHATIIMVSVFSFIVIGVATISYFIYRFNQSNEEKQSKNIQIISSQVETKLKNLYAHFAFDDALDFTTLSFGNNFEKTINEISEIYNSDINIFNTAGTLIASTQPYIYNKQLLSDKMQPNAFIQLNNYRKNTYIQSEKIAELEYLSIYATVKDDEGKVYAYVNIPYLNSQTELSQEISEFLATIMNLNAFIFLLAGVIAFMVTDRITVSFSLISEKMKAINIEQQNEEIEWKRNDEIGVLVTEYNKMVKKLETSAKALAQTEREGAWREMARQVAHEIKNPLTPMKLSIQYLQKSIENKNENIQELTNRVAFTLIEQIEQLSKIAGDFSQFANIENVQPEIFNLSNTISSLIELYKTRENIKIDWIKDNDSYLINADKVQISRLFSNLILNAIEASNNNNLIQIKIYQKKINNTVETCVEDNGTGISDDMKQKIFIPNFTTKTSGTGLGLAICKSIVEKANGSITFNTQNNIGTTFKVIFPLV